jgi:hypothetical protein
LIQALGLNKEKPASAGFFMGASHAQAAQHGLFERH